MPYDSIANRGVTNVLCENKHANTTSRQGNDDGVRPLGDRLFLTVARAKGFGKVACSTMQHRVQSLSSCSVLEVDM